MKSKKLKQEIKDNERVSVQVYSFHAWNTGSMRLQVSPERVRNRAKVFYDLNLKLSSRHRNPQFSFISYLTRKNMHFN